MEDYLKVTVEAILLVTRVWRQHESIKRNGSKGGLEGGNTDSKD